MATDYMQMVKNLLAFYNFENKKIVCIGAGGGQFIGYGQSAKRIIAIDCDKGALDQLRQAVDKNNMSNKYEFMHADFLMMDLDIHGDAVLFEFCLHEIADPAEAINRALKLADDVVIVDHGLESEWAYHVAEEEKVKISWGVVNRFNVLRHQEHSAVHRFNNYDELLAKVESQGNIAVQRIEKFKDSLDISIPITYEFALIDKQR